MDVVFINPSVGDNYQTLNLKYSAIEPPRYAGGFEIWKPPYPYRMVGCFPSSFMPFRARRKYGIEVPSAEETKFCSTLYFSGSMEFFLDLIFL